MDETADRTEFSTHLVHDVVQAGPVADVHLTIEEPAAGRTQAFQVRGDLSLRHDLLVALAHFAQTASVLDVVENAAFYLLLAHEGLQPSRFRRRRAAASEQQQGGATGARQGQRGFRGHASGAAADEDQVTFRQRKRAVGSGETDVFQRQRASPRPRYPHLQRFAQKHLLGDGVGRAVRAAEVRPQIKRPALYFGPLMSRGFGEPGETTRQWVLQTFTVESERAVESRYGDQQCTAVTGTGTQARAGTLQQLQRIVQRVVAGAGGRRQQHETTDRPVGLAVESIDRHHLRIESALYQALRQAFRQRAVAVAYPDRRPGSDR